MSLIVARTCTEIELGDGPVRLGESMPLSEFRSMPALVLLGDPGSGKTTEFKEERSALGDRAKYLKARNFAKLSLDSHPEWRDKVLFIDSLDEMRAGSDDGRVPLDEIRHRLDRLRPPGFRISCREADWLGHNDRESLDVVSPDGQVTVVRLDPLDPQSIRELLGSLIPGDVEDFIEEALHRDLWPLLENPLTLRLLADAVKKGDDWPESRRETFEMACGELASERNPEHRIAASPISPRAVMDAAGYLCALQLLSSIEGYSLPPGPHDSSFVEMDRLEHLPERISRRALKRALAARLFTAEGETAFVPVHRQVAEFMGGRYLAGLAENGLPASRITALMTSPADGRVVTELRGLSAWLAAHSAEARRQLIDADPVGVGLYGDIGGFGLHDKERLLGSLATFARQGPLFGHGRRDGRNDGYRDGTAWAFRSLATADMVPAITNLIDPEDGEQPGDRVVEFVLNVLSKAGRDLESLAVLVPHLEAILNDSERSDRVRRAALDAYLRVAPCGEAKTRELRSLLESAQDGSLPDPDDQLRGTLLGHLYPDDVSPADVWRYVIPRNLRFVGRFTSFWSRTILAKSSSKQLETLIDSWLEKDSEFRQLSQVYLKNFPIEKKIHEAIQDRPCGDEGQADRLRESQEPMPPPVPFDHDEQRYKIVQQRKEYSEEDTRQQEEWAQYLRSQEAELQSNTLAAHNLHDLALVYFGVLGNDTYTSAYDRIADFIGGDRLLASAVMAALRGAIRRDDLPDVDTTISLRTQGQPPWLAEPVLASMDLLADDPQGMSSLDEERKRRVLAIYYCWGTVIPGPGRACDALWFREDPDLVLDVLYRCAVTALRDGQEILPGMYDLDLLEDQGSLVHDTRLDLLGAFPTRIPKKQLWLFDYLLGNALEYADTDRLEALTSKKLSLKSLGVSHRVRWLAVAALLSGGQHTERLKTYSSQNERRVRHLAEFLRNTGEDSDSLYRTLSRHPDPAIHVTLVELLGRSFGPCDIDGLVTLEISTSELIGYLISQLRSMSDVEAYEGLARLVDDPGLARWRDRLTWAQELQRVVYSNASYRHPDIEQVQKTLANRAPANAADLAALLRDRLEATADHVRGDSANLWRQFWNEDCYGHPTEGKREDSCRDVLLADLKHCLPSGVDAAPEGRYAADRRADIRAFFGGFNIPIEIKKNSHRDLWSALRNQLIDLYTTDPATSGYGIYVVLWFGPDGTTRRPDGSPPATPEDLRRVLETELTPDEARKIAVIVMDVTKPGVPSTRVR